MNTRCRLTWLICGVGLVWWGCTNGWCRHSTHASYPVSSLTQEGDPPAVPVPFRLFSLPYGISMSAIGVTLPEPPPDDGEGSGLELDPGPDTCPVDFCVSWDGRLFYFLDPVPERPCYGGTAPCWHIKIFSRGHLVRAIPLLAERYFRIAVNRLGQVYAVGEDVKVFHPSGVVDDQLTTRLTKQLQEIRKIVSESARGDGEGYIQNELNIEYITVDEMGNLYVDYVLIGSKYHILRLNVDTDSPTLLPIGVPDRKGNIWRVSDSSGASVDLWRRDLEGNRTVAGRAYRYKSRLVEVYDKTGNAVRSFRMPSDPLTDFEQRVVYAKDTKIDTRGHFYQLLSPLETRQQLRGDVWIEGPCYIMEYDSDGRRVGVRAVIHLPIFAALWDLHTLWDVDGQGNLYYLEFQANRLDIMKVPRSNPR